MGNMDQQLAKLDLMKEYAVNLLRHPNDPHKAAFATTPDVGLALQIARDWPRDPVVVGEMERLVLNTDPKQFLPTKEEQARAIYHLAESDKVDVDNRLKAHRLYAELMSYIEKPQPSSMSVNVLQQKVMIVKDYGSDADWEKNLEAQQRILTSNVKLN